MNISIHYYNLVALESRKKVEQLRGIDHSNAVACVPVYVYVLEFLKRNVKSQRQKLKICIFF